MKHHLYFLQAISAVHYGSGQGEGDIDLPVAKDSVTGHPKVPGSGIKGVLRDSFEDSMKISGEEQSKAMATCLFGPSDCSHASAISIGDGRLLALPVRSFFGCFAYLTSPLVLTRIREEAKRVGISSIADLPIPTFASHVKVNRCLVLIVRFFGFFGFFGFDFERNSPVRNLLFFDCGSNIHDQKNEDDYPLMSGPRRSGPQDSD